MIRILIADDHPIVRRGLRQIVSDEADMVVVGEASDGQEVLAQVREQAWDVLVLDISMPGRNGLDVLQEVHARYPTLPVLILSTYPAEQYAVRALRAGAAGYLSKESAPSEVIAAIRHVLRGGRYISPAVGELLAQQMVGGGEQPPHELLSNRELEIVRLLASGKSVSEIATQLALSVKTVSTYRGRALEKLGLTHNVELIRYALTHGLVS